MAQHVKNLENACLDSGGMSHNPCPQTKVASLEKPPLLSFGFSSLDTLEITCESPPPTCRASEALGNHAGVWYHMFNIALMFLIYIDDPIICEESKKRRNARSNIF